MTPEDDAIGEVLVPANDLARRVGELAEDVSRDYTDADLVLIGVLKGAVFFVADLMRSANSYGSTAPRVVTPDVLVNIPEVTSLAITLIFKFSPSSR